MNVNNNPNKIVTKAPKSIAQTISDSAFDCAGITSCTNSNETCSTCAQVSCCVAGFTVAGAALGVGLNGLVALIAAKTPLIACDAVVKLGAIGGGIGGATIGACYPCLKHAAESAEPVMTQPQSVNPQTKIQHLATSDTLPLLLDESSDDELIF